MTIGRAYGREVNQAVSEDKRPPKHVDDALEGRLAAVLAGVHDVPLQGTITPAVMRRVAQHRVPVRGRTSVERCILAAAALLAFLVCWPSLALIEHGATDLITVLQQIDLFPTLAALGGFIGQGLVTVGLLLTVAGWLCLDD